MSFEGARFNRWDVFRFANIQETYQMNFKTKKEQDQFVARSGGCIGAALVFFVTTILPFLIAILVLWLIFGRS